MANEKPDSFQCGPFEVSRNPDVRVFVDKLNRLREAVDQCRVQDGVGYTVTRSSGGTTLSIRPSAGGTSAPLEHPFKLSVKKKDDEHQFFCLQGLVGFNQTKVDNIETWVKFKAPARIYMEATIDDDLTISALTLKSQKDDEEMARTEISGGRQTTARISIGLYVPTEPGKTDYRIIQNVTTDIMTPMFCYNGYPALAMTQEFLNAYNT